MTRFPVHSILSGERANQIFGLHNPEPLSEPYIISSNTRMLGTIAGVHLQAISEVQDLLELISEVTSNLFVLSTQMRKATPRDRYMKAASALPGLESQYRFWDLAHVENKFKKLRSLDEDKPEADRPEKGKPHWFACRLARTITWRRQYLQYCQKHASQISTIKENPIEYQHIPAQGLPSMPEPEFLAQTPMLATTGPRSTTTLTTPSTFLEENRPQDTTENEGEGNEEEEMAPSTQATSLGTVDGETIPIIPLEKVRIGNTEFLCLFCMHPQRYRKDRAWK